MPHGINYEHHENGIHHMMWTDVQPNTIQAYLTLFGEIMESCPENSILRILHEYRDTAAPSFGTMARGMKGLQVRDDVTLRIAHIYDDAIYPTIVKNATLVARFNANRQFFRADQKEQAVEWLLD